MLNSGGDLVDPGGRAGQDRRPPPLSHLIFFPQNLIFFLTNLIFFLRAGVCLILEEILLTLEAGLAKMGDRPEVPKYFQKEEAHEVDPDPGDPKPLKGQCNDRYTVGQGCIKFPAA